MLLALGHLVLALLVELREPLLVALAHAHLGFIRVRVNQLEISDFTALLDELVKRG